MSQAGQESGAALVDVLNGSVTPSGKLTDTWASKYSYYPASSTFAKADGDSKHEQYSEGIYVGYRYFDSFYRSINADQPASVVNYPFGYGLSYTDFQIDTSSVTTDGASVTVKAKVSNVGTRASGKEVVEVYVSAPSGTLDQPYQQLAGFAKTDLLKPGKSQTVTIGFNTADLASFDESKAANVLEKGDYLVRVGNSSRNTHVAAALRLDGDVVTEQLSHQNTDAKPQHELVSKRADFYSYPTEADEVAAAPVVALAAGSVPTTNHASALEQNVTVGKDSPYYAIDGASISSVKAYLPAGQTDWEGTGATYQAKAGETVQSVQTDPNATLYDVAKGKVSMDAFVAGLNVAQLGNIVEGASATGSTLSAAGAAGYTTAKYESLGIPALTLADGPAGLRITQKIAGSPTTYQWATAFPVGTLLAQTWNLDLIDQVGTAIGKEMKEYGVTLWLAPGMNIHRDPLNGRNFEYYSEDPYLTGLTATSITRGVQSNPGVGVTVKHYIANNQESDRDSTDAVISERAQREIYLRGFEIAVKAAQPMAVMSSYNKVNGTYTAGSYDLLTDVLRGEWCFKGLVMTDWGGIRAGVINVQYTGNDLVEPGGSPNEVISTLRKNPPEIDVNGLPVYTTTTYKAFNYTWTTWLFNGLVPSAGGTEVVSSTVDASNVNRQPASGSTIIDGISNATYQQHPTYTSVDQAYQEVKKLLAAPDPVKGLTADQIAGITLTNVTHEVAGDDSSPVVSYTVTIKGDYNTNGFDLRLGDLQRSVRTILTVAMQSAQFKQLASLQGISGIRVGSYTAQFDDLTSYLRQSLGKVTSTDTSGPKVTLQTTPEATASGWFAGDVTVTVQLGSASDTAYIAADSGELRTYTDPVTVSGEGMHLVKVTAVDEDGVPSRVKELAVKIDATKPVAKVTSADNGTLVLSATDALSGIDRVEYSLDGGTTWATYTAALSVPGAPKAVSYRATDKAGNVSSVQQVTVKGALSLSTPTIAGTVKVGKTLTATVATVTAGAKLTYQWLRNGKAISGATKVTYKLVKADKRTKVAVKVTASKSGYTDAVKTSAAKKVG